MVLSACDAARKGLFKGFTVKKVLGSINWVFKGGVFGDEALVAPGAGMIHNVTSCTVLPNGPASAMAERLKDAWDTLPELEPVLVRRASDRTFKQRARDSARWAAVMAYGVAGAEDMPARNHEEAKGVVVTGMAGVYAVARELAKAIETGAVTPSKNSVDALRAAQAMSHVSAAAAGLDVVAYVQNVDNVIKALKADKVPEWTTVLDGLVATERAIHGAAADRSYVRVAERVATFWDPRSGGAKGDELRFTDLAGARIEGVQARILPKAVLFKLANKMVVLPASDFHKVIQLVTGIRNTIGAAWCDSAAGSSLERQAAMRAARATTATIADLLAASEKVPLGEEITVAKAFKDVVAIYKTAISGPLAQQELVLLRAKQRASEPYEWMKQHLDATLSRAMSLSGAGALNAIKVFRLCPPPDINQAYALLKRWGDAARVHEASPAAMVSFKARLREVIVSAYIRKPGPRLARKPGVPEPAWWGDYMAGNMDQLPFSQLPAVLAWEQTLDLPVRSADNPANWKDSGLGADTFLEAEAGNRPPAKKNMLLRLLFDDTCPMPDEAKQYAEEISGSLLKPESMKERIAYSNHLASRQRQSRTEQGVHDIMSRHPSFAVVKTGVERDVRFDEFSRAPVRFGDVACFFSFDVTGWSANMPGNIQVASHEVWDELYRGGHYMETAKNHMGARVYSDNAGFFAWYENAGANFEGYNGKEMTALHIAIMTEAAYRLRAAHPEIPAADLRIMLMSYIDDGVARIEMPQNVVRRVFASLKRIVVDTWAEYGFTIDVLKSFPSDRFFEFLAEAYYAGVHLAHGVKAAMRLTADPFEVYETLPTRVAKLASGCRGAAGSGLQAIGAHVLQCFFVGHELVQWVKDPDLTALAWWAHLPVAFGGLGVPGLLQQSLNAAGAAIEEGIATLHQWAMWNLAARKAYCALFRSATLTRASKDVLGAPLGMRSAGPTMTVDFMPGVLIRGMASQRADGRLTGIARRFLALDDPVAHDVFAQRVVPVGQRAVMQEQLIRDLASAVPASIVRSFCSRFATKRTYGAVAGKRTLDMAAGEARREATAAYKWAAKLAR